ncbi:hypothetical protein Tco_0162133 [Tanacetum coccineum]
MAPSPEGAASPHNQVGSSPEGNGHPSLWTKVIVAIHGVGGKIPSEWTSTAKSCGLSILSEVSISPKKELVRSVTIVPSADRWNWNLESTGIFSVASARRRIDEICLPNIGEENYDWVKDMSCPNCDNAIESVVPFVLRCGYGSGNANKVERWNLDQANLNYICRMEVLACFNSYGFQTQKDVRRSLIFHLVVRLDLSKQTPI